VPEYPDPDRFTGQFEPGSNPFGISLTKVFPPQNLKGWARKAYLIKIKLVLHMLPGNADYLRSVSSCVRERKMFCGIWTPRVEDVSIDDHGVYVELIGYLQRGTESKLIHLEKVIRASPRFSRGTHQELEMTREETHRLVQYLLDGKELPEAVAEHMESSGYVIGKSIVVKGKVAKHLSEAEKRI